MSRDEHDLRAALAELEARADRAGAPSAAELAAVPRSPRSGGRCASVRWLLPLTAAAAVAIAAAVVAFVVGRHGDGSPAANSGTPPPPATTTIPAVSTSRPAPTSAAATRVLDPRAVGILEDAAKHLDSSPAWTAPAGSQFFYVHTTMATTWISVSGRAEGAGHNSDGVKIIIAGCAHGRLVSSGESGSCTLDDVPHYLADAPTSAAAWNGYFGTSAVEGKSVVYVLHNDLLSPRATAALLRYTATCSGLRTVAVPPVSGRALVGVTCTTMAAGSYGLVFDAESHRYAGFVLMDAATGKPDHYPAEIILKTKIVSAPGK